MSSVKLVIVKVTGFYYVGGFVMGDTWRLIDEPIAAGTTNPESEPAVIVMVLVVGLRAHVIG